MLTASGNVDSLRSLLTSHTFSIPEFQRNYAWEEKQVDDFWNDLEFIARKPSEDHFIGSVILLKQDGSQTVEVIDGQQRLTTIFILFALIRDEIFKCTDQQLHPTNGGVMPINVGQRATEVLFVDQQKPRLIANATIREVFFDYILRHPKHIDSQRKTFGQRQKPETRRLRKAYQKLQENLATYMVQVAGTDEQSRLGVLNNLLTCLLDNMRILQITSSSQPESINIYMTLNNRGIGLTPSDLVKSLIMKNMTDGLAGKELVRANHEILSKWGIVIDNLSDSKTEAKFDQFLRHYLLIYSKDADPIREADIFSQFEKTIKGTPSVPNSNPKQSAIKVLNDLVEKSLTYGGLLLKNDTYTNDGFIRNRFGGLNSLQDSHRVFLMAVFDENSGLDTNLQKKLLHIADAISLRWLLTSGNAQMLENLFQKLGRELINPKLNAESRVESVSEQILKEFRSDDVIQSRLQEANGNTSLIRYMYFMINEVLNHQQDASRWDTKVLEVEHIAPVSATDYWYAQLGVNNSDELEKESEYSDLVELVGNKSILEFKINASIQNRDWDVKKYGLASPIYKGYSDSQYKVTKDLLRFEDWTVELLKERNEWFIAQFFQLWSINGDGTVVDFSAWRESRTV